ncbi:Fc.00g035570.m01.CDS01 [Cosmosporella sp. VM-42]
MSTHMNSTNLPQGFSVYQPALGAQLQFFPAVGTQEHDDMMNAFIPGAALVAEKRASVALDFFEHVQLTGETFKFYPVYSMTPVASPMTVSPLQDSGYGSSYNASPVMSSWDWKQANAAAHTPSSASQRRQSSKASSSRHQTTDFSHIPGMKIMTKDGQDVTNSASRGSKTKEQRDHAHLMRIIKACEACRKKKIRCDPSHKKRSAAQAQTQAASKAAKKAKTLAQEPRVVDPTVFEADFSASIGSFTFDQSFAMADLGSLDTAAPASEPWEEFIQYPPAGLLEDYDFFADPEGFLSPQSLSSLSASSPKPVTPISRQEQLFGDGVVNPDVHLDSAQLPFNQTEGVHDYVDFNLYSPQSSFSEDDRMVPIEMSRHPTSQSQLSSASPVLPSYAPFDEGSCGKDEVTGGSMSASPEASLSISPQLLLGGGDNGLYGAYRDPGMSTRDSTSPTGLDLGSSVMSSYFQSTTDQPTPSTSGSYGVGLSDLENVISSRATYDGERSRTLVDTTSGVTNRSTTDTSGTTITGTVSSSEGAILGGNSHVEWPRVSRGESVLNAQLAAQEDIQSSSLRSNAFGNSPPGLVDIDGNADAQETTAIANLTTPYSHDRLRDVVDIQTTAIANHTAPDYCDFRDWGQVLRVFVATYRRSFFSGLLGSESHVVPGSELVELLRRVMALDDALDRSVACCTKQLARFLCLRY